MVATNSYVTAQDAKDFEPWLKSIKVGRTDAEMAFIRRACQVAQKAHEGQVRASGEPYFLHSLAVANILADLRLDHETIAAALLHDVAEDTSVTVEEIEVQFGAIVAKLVDGVTKMGQIQEYKGQSEKSKREQAQAETLRKMMLAMVDDIRVVLIKLADRTHNMRTLGPLPESKQKRIAKETMDIFAPLANRLGIWQIKWELEDRAFRCLDPDIYKEIARLVDERRISREQYITKVVTTLKDELEKHGIKSEVSGRSKHIYSIYRKMKRKGVDFDQIYDVRAVRVLVDKLEDCYAALGIVHVTWRPIPGEFDDYVAAPKDNLYKSLHTAVVGLEGKPLEVQIRTHEMHQSAEFGIAAHWKYKEGGKSDPSFDKKISWFRQLLEWKEDVADASTFIDNVKTEVFENQVHVLTPKGKVVELPFGATPVDFAYHIHTEVGHRCRGAKVNGRMVPLIHVLKNGEQVEILTAKRGGPSRDWLNPNLGYVKTARGKSKIRQWFKWQDREKNITEGRDVLERELHRLGLPKSKYDKLAREFGYTKIEDFLAAIGRGDVTPPNIVSAIKEVFEETLLKEPEELEVLPVSPRTHSKASDSDSGIKIQGIGNLLASFARCCRPVPSDDEIIGYITRGRGVTIHRKDCPNVFRLSKDNSDKLIEVYWEAQEGQTYPVDIEVDAFDRSGLLRDIAAVVANDRISFSKANVITDKRKNQAKIFATLDVTDLNQLGRILAMIEQVPNVVEARRW